MTPGLVWLNSKSGLSAYFHLFSLSTCFCFFVFLSVYRFCVFLTRRKSRNRLKFRTDTKKRDTRLQARLFQFYQSFLQTARGTPLLWCLAPSQEKVEEKVRTDVAGYIYRVTENSSPMPFQFCFKFILLLGNKLGFSSP